MSFRYLPVRTEGTSQQITYPFSVGKTKGITPGSYLITIAPGTVNNFIPSNAFQKFPINGTGIFYVKLAVFTDGGNVNAVTIIVDQSQPVRQEPTPFGLPAYLEILIALISDGNIFRTINNGSLSLSGQQLFITGVNPPAQPGELTYTSYSIWSISTF